MAGQEDESVAHAKARLGTVLRGKYRLERVLGVGGMAAVYKATHRNQSEVAVKMLHPELSLHEDVRTRFLRPARRAHRARAACRGRASATPWAAPDAAAATRASSWPRRQTH